MVCGLAADVRCWAYNPPGGLVSANLSAAMKPFCTSVIVSKDAISRMSLKNISGMIDEMLIALARCKQPTLKARPRCPLHTALRRACRAPAPMSGDVCIDAFSCRSRCAAAVSNTQCRHVVRPLTPFKAVGFRFCLPDLRAWASGVVQHSHQGEATRADRPAPVRTRGDTARVPRASARVRARSCRAHRRAHRPSSDTWTLAQTHHPAVRNESACAFRRRSGNGRSVRSKKLSFLSFIFSWNFKTFSFIVFEAFTFEYVLLDRSDLQTVPDRSPTGLRYDRYQDKQNQIHKAVQDMYPPGACIFLRRLKAKIVKKERKKAEREARKREQRERRDIERREKHERKVRHGRYRPSTACRRR